MAAGHTVTSLGRKRAWEVQHDISSPSLHTPAASVLRALAIGTPKAKGKGRIALSVLKAISRRDGAKVQLFINGKARSMYFQRKKAAKLAWTTTYRREHKKDQTNEAVKRKRRNLGSKKPRAIVGTSVEEIQKRRQERPDMRQKARELAVRNIKDRMKNAKSAKGKAAPKK